MADFVEREKILALQTELHFDNIEQLKHWKCRHIDPTDVEFLPATEVRPVVRGQWLLDTLYLSGVKKFRCSICGYKRTVDEKYEGVCWINFCPNCGADMGSI